MWAPTPFRATFDRCADGLVSQSNRSDPSILRALRSVLLAHQMVGAAAQIRIGANTPGQSNFLMSRTFAEERSPGHGCCH